MTTIEARIVDDAGALGAVIGTCTLAGDRLRTSGCDAIAGQLARMAAGGRRTERRAFELLAAEPWSNGKIWIGAPVAEPEEREA